MMETVAPADSLSSMLVTVETQGTAGGEREPVCFAIGARVLRVREVIDRWPAQEYTYFKLEADDGARYILRHTVATGEWEMHWFDHS